MKNGFKMAPSEEQEKRPHRGWRTTFRKASLVSLRLCTGLLLQCPPWAVEQLKTKIDILRTWQKLTFYEWQCRNQSSFFRLSKMRRNGIALLQSQPKNWTRSGFAFDWSRPLCSPPWNVPRRAVKNHRFQWLSKHVKVFLLFQVMLANSQKVWIKFKCKRVCCFLSSFLSSNSFF